MTTSRLKVMTIVGTRPEVIRLSRVMAALDQATDHVLVHTGQNHDHELNQIFFDELELRTPDHFLGAAGETTAQTIGQTIMSVDRVLGEEQPDAVLILGDTDSCLAAIAAKRRRIPVFHMEAGNRCFDARTRGNQPPDRRPCGRRELAIFDNRPRISAERGASGPDRVIKTGSPLMEVLAHDRPRIDQSDVLARLEGGGHYFLVSAHRAENVDSDSRLAMLVETLGAVAGAFRRTGPRQHPPPNPQANRRARDRVRSAGPAAQAVRFS